MARILVVDDNDEGRYMLEVLLRAKGHQVVCAKNGAEGLTAALADPPALVVSDIMMPEMDGFTFCREWKANDRLKGIPFVVYTATYTERKDEELAYRMGVDRFVVKPRDPEDLLEIVKQALEGSFGEGQRPDDGAFGGDGTVLKEYSEALFRKLEKKVADLEASKRALERTIAERMRAEEALRDSEAKYRIVADNTYSWEFWLDPHGSFIYSSPSCLRVTGRGREQFLADPDLLRRIVHPDDLAVFDSHREKAVSARECGVLEFRILHADGSARRIAHECMPVTGDDGRFLGTRGSNRDITEKKRLEEMLVHVQRMDAVGLLAGGIAEEFNRLMSAIVASVDHIPSSVTKNDPLRESLDQVLAITARASALTRDLLAFSRRQEMKPVLIDFNRLVRGQEAMLRKMAGDRIRLSFSLGNEPLRVSADGRRLEQVLMNLVANAREAMPWGGTVAISTEAVEVDEDFVRRHGQGSPGPYALLSVADEGAGMSEQVRNRVFEPFFTIKGEGSGAGLGLSVAYGIVKQHDGFILVESEQGKGSTFKVGLPIQKRDKGQGERN